MTEFSDDVLACRLSTLDIPVDPSAVTRRVLEASHRRPQYRLTLQRLAIAVPLVLVLVSAGLSYYAPVFAQTLADAPIAGSVAGWLLRQVGLAGVPHRVSTFGDKATSSGYTIELVGGYADAGRTVLFLRLTPPANAFSTLRPVEVTDQFGHSYPMTGAAWNSDAGEGLIMLTPIDGLAAKLGARLRIAFNEIQEGPGPNTRRIAGRWDLTATLAVDEGRDVPVPDGVQLGEARVTFTRVRALAVGVLVEFRIESVDIDLLERRIPDGLKGRPAFRVSLVDASGHVAMQLLGGTAGRGADRSRRTIEGSWLWQADEPGSYVLSVEWEGVGNGTRTISVP